MQDFDDDIGSMFPLHSPKKAKSEAELLRERNIKERDAFFASLLIDSEFAEAVEALSISYKENAPKQYNLVTKVKPRRKSHRDETFKFFGKIPTEMRRSSRLQNVAPLYTVNDLIDETDTKRRKAFNGFQNDSDVEDIEEIVYKPKVKRQSSNRGRAKHVFIPVEEVTEEMLSNVVKRVSDKTYSERGSSCHQCRQKTTDQKTCCRNTECFGVRGQFCGVCLENRYGEDAVRALKDPNWHCPVCRGVCNCSFCRAKEGKRPTGILAPLAQKYGHKSVKDFLDSLKGEGDYEDETRNPIKLLGFSKDLCFAQMGGKVKHKFEYICDPKKFRAYCDKLDYSLLTFKPYKPILRLLGFQGNVAKIENGESDLSCVNCKFSQELNI